MEHPKLNFFSLLDVGRWTLCIPMIFMSLVCVLAVRIILQKIVIGVDENGNKYYDHSLTEIEKGKLIDEVGALSTTLPSGNESPYLSVGKDTKLLSILQLNPQEIAEAEARMREIEAAGDSKVRFQFIGEQGAREADLSL